METTPVTLTTVAGLVKAGRTYDYECSRTTHRIQRTISILEAMGASRSVTHNEKARAWDSATQRERHDCGANGHRCTTVWSAWVTDEVFNAAHAAAEVAISVRADWMRRPIKK